MKDKVLKEHLEIETLKALTYTQINELLNKLTSENKELKKQLSIHDVVNSNFICNLVENVKEKCKTQCMWCECEH